MAPSGLTKAWRLWRHCCCRFGIFPLLVAPIVTLGCLLSLYSSTGCKFVELDIGFQPANEGWEGEESPIYFGLFYYYNSSAVRNLSYQDQLHEGCMSFSDELYSIYIDNDRTFKMTRVMTYISCISSFVAMVCGSEKCVFSCAI